MSTYIVRASGREYGVRLGSDGRVWIEGRPEAIVVWSVDEAGDYRVAIGERVLRAVVHEEDQARWVFTDGRGYEVKIEPRRGATRSRSAHHEMLEAPMPATVRLLCVEPGQRVRGGDLLVLLEAMKMELPVRAPRDATVGRVRCRPGEIVQPGAPLLELEQP